MEEKKIVVAVQNPYLDARARQTRMQVNNVTVVIGLAIIGAVGYWLYGLIMSWPTVSAPYKYVLAFYFYAIFVPVHSFVDVWDWMMDIHITPFPNLNGLIGLIGMALYSFLTLFVIIPLSLGYILKKLKLTWGNLFALFLAPGFLAIVWYIVASVLGWLFATS